MATSRSRRARRARVCSAWSASSRSPTPRPPSRSSPSRHLWNAGIFVFPGEHLLDHLRRLEPVLAASVTTAAADPSRLDDIYPGVSGAADRHRGDGAPRPASTPPSSTAAGAISAPGKHLSELLGGNAAAIRRRARRWRSTQNDNLLWSEDGVIAVLGVEGLAVVQSGNAVLVVPKARSQEVKRLVEELRAAGVGCICSEPSAERYRESNPCGSGAAEELELPGLRRSSSSANARRALEIAASRASKSRSASARAATAGARRRFSGHHLPRHRSAAFLDP